MVVGMTSAATQDSFIAVNIVDHIEHSAYLVYKDSPIVRFF